MSPSTITIERLERIEDADRDRLNAFLPQLSNSIKTLTSEELSEVVDWQSNRIYVARDNGAIIGAIILVIVKIFAGTKCWIEDVIVDEAYRGRGIGRRLTYRALGEAPQGAKSVDLTSKPSRVEAHRLYKSIGFVERDTVVFRHTLG